MLEGMWLEKVKGLAGGAPDAAAVSHGNAGGSCSSATMVTSEQQTFDRPRKEHQQQTPTLQYMEPCTQGEGSSGRGIAGDWRSCACPPAVWEEPSEKGVDRCGRGVRGSGTESALGCCSGWWSVSAGAVLRAAWRRAALRRSPGPIASSAEGNRGLSINGFGPRLWLSTPSSKKQTFRLAHQAAGQMPQACLFLSLLTRADHEVHDC